MISPSDILHGKVLIVDDQPANVLLLERMLRGAGYVAVTSTMDPGAVCDLHLKNGYDLILLDLQMPGMDGFQVMEGLKKVENRGYLPVLAITAHPDHKLRALQGGAKDFVSIPFDMAEVLMRIHNMLEIRLLHKQAEEMNLELEQRVKERTSTLTALNKELETFAYSASHDLRAPLRKISAFSQAILAGGQSKLARDDQEYFTRIRASAAHMNRLIDHILNLARVTQQPIILADVDLSAIALKIAGDLKMNEPSRKINFVIERGARVHGDQDLLTIALRNLLDNAWKFTSKHPEARIEFGSKTTSGQTVYFVCDDGAGFDMAYADKLFSAFHRQHKEDDFPGTGIGLGLAERIIRRHKGQIWAHARVEEGATFFFTLNAEGG